MAQQIPLPPYPASGGPAIANQADTYRGRYRQRISIIQTELAACEEAFAKALARSDAANLTQSRIDDLATRAKRNARR